MKIKVAYDISIVASYFYRSDFKVGIIRVVEEILREIIKINGLELTLIGLCGEYPGTASILSLLYVENSRNWISCNYNNCLESRLGLEKFYKEVFKIYCSEKFQLLPKYSLASIIFRVIFKSSHYVYRTEGCPVFDYKNFDVLHSPYPQLPPEEITGGIPRVLTVHDLIPVTATKFVPPTLTAYFQKIINSINFEHDWIICNSEYTKQEFCEYTGMSPNRVFVTPLAAANHFHPVTDWDTIAATRQRYGIPQGDYFLCLASHLEPRKNLPHLIRCFFRLLSEQPSLDIYLVLVGSKRYKRDDVFSAVKGYSQFSSKVIFTDYVSDEDLSAIYSGAKAFIFPSLYEGFGLPPLEAMQCGIPVIASNTTSLPEVVGDAGILVEPKDEDSLCQAMLNLLNDTNLCQQLSQKSLERAKNFSWAKCAEQTVEVYKKAVSNK